MVEPHPEPLPYATPSKRRGPVIGRFGAVVIGIAAIIILWYGFWYIQAWQFDRVANRSDRPLSVICFVLGATLLALSVYLFRSARRSVSAGE